MSNLSGIELEAPTNDFDVLPAGKYLMHVKDSELRDTNAGTGTYLKVVLEILDGKYSGRLIFENINLTNPNPIAVEIGKKALSGLSWATLGRAPEDSNELHSIPFIGHVKVQPARGDFDESNGIKKYEALPKGAEAPKAAESEPEAKGAWWDK